MSDKSLFNLDIVVGFFELGSKEDQKNNTINVPYTNRTSCRCGN